MEKIEVRSRIKKVISKVLSVDEQAIAENANFVFDLGADSQQSLELVAAFQEEFNITMDEDKAFSAQTVSQAVDVISGYLN
ncbi:MAG: acyl carrier protein [bacterium]|nr:acyl carrier protein [bacterium]